MRGSGALIASGTGAIALSKWLLILILARAAGGTDAVGEYSSLLAIATPLFVASQLGLRTILVSSRTPRAWSAYVLLRLCGSSAAAIVLCLAGIALQFNWGLILALTCVKVADSVLDLLLGRLQYSGRLRLLGAAMVASALLGTICAAFAFMMSGSGYVAVAATGIATAIVSVAISRVALSGTYNGGGFTFSQLKMTIVDALPVTGSQFLASFLFQIPVLFLATVGTASDVGIYAAAAYLLTFASLLGSTLQTVLITPMRQMLESKGVSAVRASGIHHSVRVVVLGATAGVIVVAFGQEVLATVYGSEFYISREALFLLSWAATATVVAFVFSVILNVLNRYARIFSIMAVGCIVSFAVAVGLSQAPGDAVLLASAVALAGAGSRAVGMVLASARD